MSDTPINVDDYERLARARMDPSAFDYYAGGSGQERTLAANRSAFDAIQFRPRVLVDVSHVDLVTTVLGHRISFPVMLAPTAFNRLACDEGEMAAARAAGASGTVMIASTLSTCTLEDVASVATGPLWFQLYVYRDRGLTSELIARAEAAGYRALVLTVDTPLLGRRERDVRNRFTLPAGLSMRNFDSRLSDATRWGAQSSFSAYVHELFDPSLTWKDVDWLRSRTKLPIVLKGVLTAEDSRCAADAGAAGLVVSNHGGRQLDGVAATISSLPEVVDAVAGRMEVLLDGGIRRGTDVLKALAFGARAVLIGRAYLWGLAVAGENGVRDVLRILRDELELSMALAGRTSIAAINESLLRRPQA